MRAAGKRTLLVVNDKEGGGGFEGEALAKLGRFNLFEWVGE